MICWRTARISGSLATSLIVSSRSIAGALVTARYASRSSTSRHPRPAAIPATTSFGTPIRAMSCRRSQTAVTRADVIVGMRRVAASLRRPIDLIEQDRRDPGGAGPVRPGPTRRLRALWCRAASMTDALAAPAPAPGTLHNVTLSLCSSTASPCGNCARAASRSTTTFSSRPGCSSNLTIAGESPRQGCPE